MQAHLLKKHSETRGRESEVAARRVSRDIGLAFAHGDRIKELL